MGGTIKFPRVLPIPLQVVFQRDQNLSEKWRITLVRYTHKNKQLELPCSNIYILNSGTVESNLLHEGYMKDLTVWFTYKNLTDHFLF